jgi:hypothetical protein
MKFKKIRWSTHTWLVFSERADVVRSTLSKHITCRLLCLITRHSLEHSFDHWNWGSSFQTAKIIFQFIFTWKTLKNKIETLNLFLTPKHPIITLKTKNKWIKFFYGLGSSFSSLVKEKHNLHWTIIKKIDELINIKIQDQSLYWLEYDHLSTLSLL